MMTEEHLPEGLDLAREMARRTRGGRAGGEPAPRKPKPGPGATDGPEPLSEVLKDVIAARGWASEVSLHHLLGRWPELVGAVNAQHSVPEGYFEKVLTIRAESTTWAASLREIASALVAKLNEALGQGTVERVVVLGPVAPSWKKGRRSVPGRGPRDTYG